MTAEELGKIIAWHEMQCLELKESFNVEGIETAKFGVLGIKQMLQIGLLAQKLARKLA